MASPVKTPDLPGMISQYTALWDKRPRKYKNVLLEVTLFILIMELAERLSYYGINQGLKNFMQKRLGWSLVSASALKSTWTSICYMSPLFGAYLGDEKWGRYRVILIFGIWYCIGDFMVAIAAHPSVYHHPSIGTIVFVIGLYLGVGIGTGSIKSNVITFGADQFDVRDAIENQLKDTYFSYFYFCINFGAAFSYGYLSYLSVNGSNWIAAEYGYFATYLICACVMLFAIISFIIGTKRYVIATPHDQSISTLIRLLFTLPSYHYKGSILLYGTLTMFSSVFINVIAAFTVEYGKIGEYLAYLSAISVIIGIISWVYCGHNTEFMNQAKQSYGGAFNDEQVDGYQKLVRCFPFAAYTIIWQCTYDQTDANFQSMTQQCDLRFNRSKDNSPQIPGAMLGVFDPLVIMICIPILDSMIYPLYFRVFKKKPSSFGKATAGLVIAVMGVMWSGLFEILRRQSGPLIGSNGQFILDHGSSQPMNHIHWIAAIPMYVFIALAECLVNVTAYDVFYSTVPMSLKSTSQSINLLMSSMGASLTSVFTIMFRPYLKHDDLNQNHLEYMYFTMGFISFLNVFAFIVTMYKMNFGMASSIQVNNEFDLQKESTEIRVSYHSIAEQK